MPIRFYCPLGHRLVVPDERAGKKGRCPQCHQKVYVPVAEPRPSGRFTRGQAPQGIALEHAGDAPLEILQPPGAAGKPAPEKAPSRKGPAAAPKPTSDIADSKDPIGMALAEITQMQSGAKKPIIYMHTRDDLHEEGSISKRLPPQANRSQPSEAEARAAAPPLAAAAEPLPDAAHVPPKNPAMQPAAGPAVSAPPAANSPASPATTPMAALPAVAAPAVAAPAVAAPAVAAPAVAIRPASVASGWIRPAAAVEVDRAYRPDDSQWQLVYALAGALVLVALISSWPALVHFQARQASGWVAVVLLVSGAELVYVVWLLSLADWSTLRVGTVLCAAVAVIYALGLAIIEGASDAQAIPLGLTEVRSRAGLWCALQMGLLSAMCYGFGRQAKFWREDAGDFGEPM